MRTKKSAILLAAAAVAGLVAFILLVPHYSLYYSVDSKLDRSQAIEMSRKIAEKFGTHLSRDLMQNTVFKTDYVSMEYLGNRLGTAATNRLVRSDSIPLNGWRIAWFDPSKQTTDGTKLAVVITEGGKLSTFKLFVPDSVTGPDLSREEAMDIFKGEWNRLALSRLTGADLAGWRLNESHSIKKEHRQDWALTYLKDSTGVPGLKEELSVRLTGQGISFLDLSYYPPEQFRTGVASTASPFVFMTFLSWVVVFVLFAFGLILFLKRYNEGEAGIGSAMFVALLYYIAAGTGVVLSFPSIGSGTTIGTMNLFYVNVIALALVLLLWFPLFALLSFSSWGIGESSARAIWPDKLRTFDALSHFRIFNDGLGLSTLRGYAYGGIILGIYAVVHPIFHLSGSVGSFSGSITLLDSYFPAIAALSSGLAVGLFSETFYRFGVLSYFGKKRLAKGIAVSAVLFIPSLFYPLPFGDYLALPRIIMSLALAAILIFLFLRHDFITAFVASSLVASAQGLIPIFASSNSFFAANSVLSVILLSIPVAVSLIGLWKKQAFELTVDLMPAHIRRISERERMARELEIAKNVQNNLLPRTTPSVPQMEFGGICIPALEVGGDYYDFVNMRDGLVGTAIADVSGKGLPAAIYMTLTKGALQASAEDHSSPRKVLSKINQIVYNSISRGTFISMIYAVIDTRSRKVKFARAGHNPLALFSSNSTSARLFTPNGLALGLDDGDKFDSTLEEMEITLLPGDALVFYTDGFTEAMDTEANEFGEERLIQLIESARHLPVREMLAKIDAGVRKFAGNAPQHDDMTMVVIKVRQD